MGGRGTTSKEPTNLELSLHISSLLVYPSAVCIRQMGYQYMVSTHSLTSPQYHLCFLQGILLYDSSRALVTHNVNPNHTVTPLYNNESPCHTQLFLSLLGKGDKDVKQEVTLN